MARARKILGVDFVLIRRRFLVLIEFVKKMLHRILFVIYYVMTDGTLPHSSIPLLLSTRPALPPRRAGILASRG